MQEVVYRCLFTAVRTILVYVAVRTVTSFIDEFCERVYGTIFLRDIIHSNTKHKFWLKYKFLIDILLVAIIALTFISILLDEGKQGLFDISDLIDCIVNAQILRCIAILVTPLPRACDTDRTLLSYGTNDLIISGHTLTAVMLLMAVESYPVLILGVLCCLAMCWILIASREHYTVDVLLGLVIGYLYFERFYLATPING